MGYLHKIASFVLLPVMLISFAGAKFHVHVCGRTGEIFAEVHLLNNSHDLHSKSCCAQPVAHFSCCGETCTEKNEFDDGTCCVDLQKEIVTDRDFNISFNTTNFSPAVLELAMSASQGITGLDILSGNPAPGYKAEWSWPPQKSRTVLLI